MKEIEKPWLEFGYYCFAHEGPNGLKVERISKEVGKNKSSFYHLFANLEIFLDRLLSYHVDQAKIVVEKEANAENERDLVKAIMEHKIDLLFSRQLRIHRENSNFEKCFIQVNQISIPAILPVWKKIIGLNEDSSLAQMVLHLSMENFYLQITSETLTESWLLGYLSNIRDMVSKFRQSSPNTSLDVGV